MKFIRHVLSHLLLISLLAGVCVVYFFRYELLPDRYTQKIDHYAVAIHPRLLDVANSKPVITEETQAVAITEQPAIEVAKTEVVAEEITATSNNTDEVPVPEEAAPEIAVDEKAQEETVAETKAELEKEIVVVTETEVKEEAKAEEMRTEMVEQKTTEPEAVVSDKQGADFHTILRDARTAFAQGNLDAAVTKYNELIELENDEADFHGELGNVYYAMGKWNEAGASYYEAAVRLIENKQMAQVGYLQRVIQGLDAERAEKLANQLANR
jgi:hypothetical protein